MNSTEINCYLFKSKTEIRRFVLSLPKYTNLIHQIRLAYKNMLDYEQIKVLWMNSSKEMIHIKNDQDLNEAIKQVKAPFIFNIYIDTNSAEDFMPDIFYI
jgi:hypothetical protein